MTERRRPMESAWKAKWRAELSNKELQALNPFVKNYLRANLLIVGGNLSPEKKPYVVKNHWYKT